MIKKILIGTDFSAASKNLVDCCGEFATWGINEALLVHVLDIQKVGGLYETLKKEELPKIKAQTEILSKKGIRASFEMPIGIPYVEINRLAEKKNIDLIVIASHGETLSQEFLIGSVADSIIRNIRKPLLVYKYEIIEKEDQATFKLKCKNVLSKMLYATDFSDNAKHALTYLKKIIKRTKSPVHLVHVQDKIRISPHLEDKLKEFNRINTERLKRVKEELKNCGASEVTFSIPYGIPIRCLLEEIKKVKPSLVLMGSQGCGWIEELFVGSVAHNLTRFSPVPVMLIPWKK